MNTLKLKHNKIHYKDYLHHFKLIQLDFFQVLEKFVISKSK